MLRQLNRERDQREAEIARRRGGEHRQMGDVDVRGAEETQIIIDDARAVLPVIGTVPPPLPEPITTTSKSARCTQRGSVTGVVGVGVGKVTAPGRRRVTSPSPMGASSRSRRARNPGPGRLATRTAACSFAVKPLP